MLRELLIEECKKSWNLRYVYESKIKQGFFVAAKEGCTDYAIWLYFDADYTKLLGQDFKHELRINLPVEKVVSLLQTYATADGLTTSFSEEDKELIISWGDQ